MKYRNGFLIEERYKTRLNGSSLVPLTLPQGFRIFISAVPHPTWSQKNAHLIVAYLIIGFLVLISFGVAFIIVTALSELFGI